MLNVITAQTQKNGSRYPTHPYTTWHGNFGVVLEMGADLTFYILEYAGMRLARREIG